ncbi:hypothetical protein EXIGLDRAFT_166306 [Exidia glandulosa HHB12029]|uniref:Uncharacterized protein n=1 Tax=Exidia glandulosa HHB12029 TaxID=1314781 RepID=A0A165N4X6_EXIGL|nr:hypothetical protein EXIGLDRAFT_166306 [Exidia glandulosa HHB12029]
MENDKYLDESTKKHSSRKRPASRDALSRNHSARRSSPSYATPSPPQRPYAALHNKRRRLDSTTATTTTFRGRKSPARDEPADDIEDSICERLSRMLTEEPTVEVDPPKDEDANYHEDDTESSTDDTLSPSWRWTLGRRSGAMRVGRSSPKSHHYTLEGDVEMADASDASDEPPACDDFRHRPKVHLSMPLPPLLDLEKKNLNSWHTWFLDFFDWQLQLDAWTTKSNVFKAMSKASGQPRLEFATIALRLAPYVEAAIRRARTRGHKTEPRGPGPMAQNAVTGSSFERDEEDEAHQVMHDVSVDFRITAPTADNDIAMSIDEAIEQETDVTSAVKEESPSPLPHVLGPVRQLQTPPASQPREIQPSPPIPVEVDRTLILTEAELAKLAEGLVWSNGRKKRVVWQWMRIAFPYRLRDFKDSDFEQAYAAQKDEVEAIIWSRA